MLPRKTVLYFVYSNPAVYPPLEQSSQLIASSGWTVRLLGVTVRGAEDLTFPKHPNIRTLLLRGPEVGILQKIGYLLFSLWVLSWVAIWRPRWVYASDPLACPIALGISFLPKVRVV